MEQTRQFYQTPLLWRKLKENLIKDINDSQLMMCEIEVIIAELYKEVQLGAQQEYQQALQQQAAEFESIKEQKEEE